MKRAASVNPLWRQIAVHAFSRESSVLGSRNGSHLCNCPFQARSAKTESTSVWITIRAPTALSASIWNGTTGENMGTLV